MINRRLIFPITMFALAALSFGYGTWQWLTARAVQASADRRVASILGTVEGMTAWSDRQKQAFYLALFENYPAAPSVLGIELSGIFAADGTDDQCANDGQRAVCRSLRSAGADAATVSSVCGACVP
jgi:hypothetical protein